MKTNPENDGVITHDFPVWRKKANFILALNLAGPDVPKEWKWEQIWARKIEDNTFEVCCIPFFAYGLALGDLVNTHTLNGKQYVINEVIERMEHSTFRVWFLEIEKWSFVIKNIQKLGCLVEIRWEKSKLIAIDAPAPEIRSKLESYLKDLESMGIVTCEIAA